MDKTLQPCPFCGSEAELVESDYGMYMTGYAVYLKEGRDENIRQWHKHKIIRQRCNDGV